MRVLIVHAHENPESFCSALKDRAIRVLADRGDRVSVSDLYAMNFNPVGGRHDFTRLSNAPYYKYQMEQLHAAVHGTFAPELRREMDKLADADLVNLSFPLWWFSVPAILKGWLDRVLAMGFAYGGDSGMYDTGPFRGKRAFVTVTTGGPASAYTADGPNGDMADILYGLHHGVFRFTGMTPLPPFVVYGASHLTDPEREQALARYEDCLRSL